jgi:cell wall-associated NlpC family hydrolase
MTLAEMAAVNATTPAQRILTVAEAARVAAANRPYTWGGRTPAGFDCSGFVTYVFDRVFGTGNPPRMTAEGLYTSTLFVAVSGTPQPGDLIFFSDGGSRATHVAIIAANNRFIGSQSSTGVAYVHLDNPYWRTKVLGYRRWAGVNGKVVSR